MKKFFQIVFCLLLSFTVFAQDKKDTTLSKKAIGFNLATTYEMSNGQSGDWKYAFHVFAIINLRKNVNFNIGLSYDFLQDHSSLTLDYNNSELHRKTERNYSVLNIPASFSFQLNKQKLKPFFEVGLQGSILEQNQFVSDDEIFHTKEKPFKNGSFIAFGDLGLGFIYKINSKIDFSLSSNYYKSFIPLVWKYTNLSGEIVSEKVYLNYFKGNIGVLYHFNK